MAEFRFTNEYTPSQHAGVMDVLRQPRLWVPETDYPDHGEWLDKAETQLAENKKRSMVAYYGSIAVGAIVYQRHENMPETVEIKNISVQPETRGRYVGSFLLRNVGLEATQNDFPQCGQLIVDTKTSNVEMITFLMRHNYTLTSVEDLYQLGTGPDAVLTKTVNT